jgi:hypothetical protein
MNPRTQAKNRFTNARNVFLFIDNEEIEILADEMTFDELNELDEYIEHSRLEPLKKLIEHVRFRIYGSASIKFLRNKARRLGIKYITRMRKFELVDAIENELARRNAAATTTAEIEAETS